jgi:hypothetical protein
MNGFRNASYVGFVLYLIGAVVIGYGLYNLSIEKNLDKVGLKTKGKVFDLAVVEPYRKAMVESKDAKGKTHRFEDKLFWNHSFQKYTKGQEVEVLYDPADPIRTAVINDFFSTRHRAAVAGHCGRYSLHRGFYTAEDYAAPGQGARRAYGKSVISE